MASPDVIVVGGGAVGTAIAYFLAREGVRVTLLEREDLASQASGAAAGMLAPICESSGEGAFFEFGLRSLEMMPALAAELLELSGVDPQYVASGVLRVALSEAEALHLREQAARLQRFGLQWLAAEPACAREPALTPDNCGTLWSPREGHVFSPQLTRAYAGAAARYGATIVTGMPALGLLMEGDRVTGVISPGGPMPSGHVVLAAGVWTRFCVEWLGRRLPLEPVRGQILALGAPPSAPRSIVWGEEAYLVPKRNGTVIVGATSERAGFDRRTTVTGVASLLMAAPRLLPALSDAPFLQAWAGLRPETPDQLPVIGPVPGIEGLTLAAGHYRNGVLLSPATARLVADWITRSTLPDSACPFLPSRLIGSG